MAVAESPHPLPPPDDSSWSSIDVVRGRELHGGYQSRVFEAERMGARVVVKLTDSRLVDQELFRQRVDVLAALAEMDDSAVGPIRTRGRHVVELGEWLAVVSPFVVGRSPDVADEDDVRRMASTMARLHRSLAQLDPVDLPAVAAVTAAEPTHDDVAWSRRQLLHGDFSHSNLLFADLRAHVFDFDDCGYGPVEFDIGNTLYMMLFDAAMSSDMERYEHFRRWFVDEYQSASGGDVPDELVETAITLRVDALDRWIEQPDSAPIGIRTATPEWRDSLRAFVMHVRSGPAPRSATS